MEKQLNLIQKGADLALPCNNELGQKRLERE